MHFPHLADGMDSHTERARHSERFQRLDPAGRGRCCLSTGCHIRAGGLGGRNISCQPLLILRCFQVLFLLGDLFHQIALKVLGLVDQFLEFLTSGDQILKQSVRLRALAFKGDFRRAQFLFYRLQRRFLKNQFRLHRGNLLRNRTNFLQAALICRVDLLHHADAVQKIGEAVGPENNSPVRNIAVFFHGPQAFFIFFIQIIQMQIRHIQFILLVRNQKRIGCNLIVDVIDLSMQQLNFLVDGIFACNDASDLIVIFFQLTFDILQLGIDLFFLFFQRRYLLPDFTGRGCAYFGGDQTQNQAQQHNYCQKACHGRYPAFTISHGFAPKNGV